MFLLNDEKIAVRPKIAETELLRLLGGRGNGQLSNGTKKRVENLSDAITDILRPEIQYAVKAISRITPTTVELEAGPVFRSRKLATSLAQCYQVICFVATIGGELESLIRERAAVRRMSEAYILEALGSGLVEDVVEKFQSHMAQYFARSGRAVSLRFSPGYCDWPLEEQRKLLGVFAASRLNVELSEDCLMIPRKSISGLFGVAEAITSAEGGKPYKAFNPCKQCNAKGCRARREGDLF